ncbi:MAG: hypothetical protein ACK46X_06320, partial [Candidatus Sericytochromatia bacterium]
AAHRPLPGGAPPPRGAARPHTTSVAAKPAADASAVEGGLQKLRAVKRGGTGRLPWEEPATTPPTTLVGAVTAAKGKPAPEAKPLPGARVVNTAHAEDIKQAEGKQTCAAANKQMAMAERNPAQYRQMVKELEAKGRAVLANGEVIALSPANRRYIDGLAGLSPDERENMKVQAALMDYANGNETYDMATDLSMREDGTTHVGLTARQAAKLDKLDDSTETATPEALQEEAAQSRNFFMRMIQAVCQQFGYDGPGYVSAVTDVVRQELERARLERRELVLALAVENGQTDSHMVTVTAVDGDGAVTVRDTAGERTLSADAFASALPRTDDSDVGEGTTRGSTSGGSGGRR